MLIAILSEKAHQYQNFIQHALDTGYTISILTHQPEKISLRHPNLNVIQGDLENTASINNFLNKADVVICLFKQSTTTAVSNVVNGMQHHNIRRLILFAENLTEMHAAQENGSFLRKMFSHRDEALNEADILRRSDRDWTILQPIDSNTPIETQYRIDISGSTLQEAKKNFTKLILQQITDANSIAKVLSI